LVGVHRNDGPGGIEPRVPSISQLERDYAA
jgi:hypothetical protein